MVYLTKDEFAIKKNFADWDAYYAKHGYPSAEGMDDMLEEMSALMNNEMGTNGTDLSDSNYTTLLRAICYKGVQYMIDEELSRDQERQRTIYPPIDYMNERHRNRLRSIGKQKGYRVIGKWVF